MDPEVAAEETPFEEEVEEEVVEEEEEEEEEDAYARLGEATEVKLFGKWSFDDVEVRDISLVVSIPPPFPITPSSKTVLYCVHFDVRLIQLCHLAVFFSSAETLATIFTGLHRLYW